jgi:hypothetical protein
MLANRWMEIACPNIPSSNCGSKARNCPLSNEANAVRLIRHIRVGLGRVAGGQWISRHGMIYKVFNQLQNPLMD